jgi:hypothetical protein
MKDVRSLSEAARRKELQENGIGGGRAGSDRVVRRKRLARRLGCRDLWVLNADVSSGVRDRVWLAEVAGLGRGDILAGEGCGNTVVG